MIWKELIKLALIGTDRGELPAGMKKQLHSMGIDTNQDPPALIMESAAYMGPMQKAGKKLKDWPGVLTGSGAGDLFPICSTKSARHLSSIVNGTFEEALAEFLDQLQKNQKRIPPEYLPELIEKSLDNKILQEQILQLAGSRGRWLIKQNPDWRALSFDIPPIDWYTASKQERLELLHRLRLQQPRQALELIKTTWDEDDLGSRVAFLKTFATGISAEDEGFLESCLDDSRKEIRLVAAGLLAGIDTSAFVQRMVERATRMIVLKTQRKLKGKLEIKLPDKLDRAALRDGIGAVKIRYSTQSARARQSKGNNKQGWLAQILSCVPPKTWEKHFDKSTSEVFDLFLHSEEGPSLLQSVVEATNRHFDEGWATLLLQCWMARHEQPRWESLDASALIDKLTPGLFNKIALEAFERNPQLPGEQTPLDVLLLKSHHPWEDKLLAYWLRALQNWLNQGYSPYWEGAQYRLIMRRAAYCCHPKHLNALQKSFRSAKRPWSGWEKEIFQFIQILQFRKEMLEELEKQ